MLTFNENDIRTEGSEATVGAADVATGSGAPVGRELAEVIERHLPLVEHVVFQVAVNFPKHVDRDELARAGAVGLIEAAQRYDASRGVPFDRFAAQRIRGAILDAVRAADWAPRSLRRASRTLQAARQHLTAELGRQPTSNEVARELDLPVEKVADLDQRIHRSVVLTLDTPVATDDSDQVALADVVQDDSPQPIELMERREMHAYLRDAVSLLPERHRTVIVGYFFQSRTSQELAELLGVTESRISQLRSEAFAMMREGLDAQFVPTEDEPRGERHPRGRAARRRAAYAEALGGHTAWHERFQAVEIIDLHPDVDPVGGSIDLDDFDDLDLEAL